MSVYSSVASSSRSQHRRKGGDDGEDGDDLLDQRQSLEAGVFGVLFTLSKEKSENNWKFSLLKAVLDFWQLFVTVIDPVQGWNINTDSTIWKVVGFWNFIILQEQGYKIYIAVLYTLVCLLVLNLALCVWVAISFKKRQFDYVWPIQVLRLFTSVFFQVFDIASLNLLQIGISCQYVGVDSDIRGHVYLFPDVSCLSMPHLFHAVVSALALVVFVLVALLLNMAEVELNPLSKRPSSTGHSGPEVWGFAIKTGMTLVNAFIAPGWLKVQSILMTALSGMLAWLYFRWSPHMVGWMNHVKTGSYTAVVSSAVLSIVLLFHPGVKAESLDSFRNSLTKAMLALLAPMGLLGAGASYLRLRMFTTKVVEKYRNAPPDARPKEIYKFKDPRDVEVVSRVARKWVKLDVVDKGAALQGETVIKAGLVLYPNDAYMALVYANFLIDVKDNAPAGYRQLQASTKLKPNVMCRFMIFVREQEQQQRSASSGGGGGGAGQIDLVSYVEFQKSQRMVMRHHKEALMAICAFWQVLLRNHVSFKSLAQALNKIEKSVSNAEMAYKVALERYTDSAKLMRLYGKFLQMVKNDPWRATEYFEEAERLANKQEMEAASGEAEGGFPRVDDNNSSVVIINGRGIIQLTNKTTAVLFGYKKGELDGKAVSTLMPAPFSQKHQSTIKAYTSSDDKEGYVVGKSRQVVGLHQDRYGFPLRISVTKTSGIGEDATFMGLLEGIPVDPSLCLAWVNRSGTISCVDQRFGMWFGYAPGELLGANIAGVLRVEGAGEPGQTDSARLDAMLSRLMDESDTKPPPETYVHDQLPPFQASPAGMGLCVVHKYGGSVPCEVCVIPSGTSTIPLHLIMLHRVNPEPSLLMVADPKGALRHLSSDLAVMLGYTSGPPNLNTLKLTDLMHPTWGTLHAPKWLKEPEPVIPAYSCRAAQNLTQQLIDVKGKPVPVRMIVETTDEHGEPLHIIKMTKATLQQAQDDRRLQLSVNHQGLITAVLGATPASLFGIDPKVLTGRPLHSIIPLLADAEANGGQDVVPTGDVVDEFHNMGLDAFATPVLNALIKKAMDRPGYSWRVGVSPPGEEAAIKRQVKDPALAQSMLAKVCKPAVMQMDVNTHTGVAGYSNDGAMPLGSSGHTHLSLTVSLWRADLLSVCAEVDKDGAILKMENDDYCPPGLMFGVPSLRLRGDALMKLLGARSLVDLGAEQEKKGGLKTTSAAQATVKLYPALNLAKAVHYDGQPLAVTCQVAVKGYKRWVLLHVFRPSRGSPAALSALLPTNAPPSNLNVYANRSESQLQMPNTTELLLSQRPLVAVASHSMRAPASLPNNDDFISRLPDVPPVSPTVRLVRRSVSIKPPSPEPEQPHPGSDSAYGANKGDMDSPSQNKATRFSLPNQNMAADAAAAEAAGPLSPRLSGNGSGSRGGSRRGESRGSNRVASIRGESRGTNKGDSAEELTRGTAADESHHPVVDPETEKLLSRLGSDSRRPRPSSLGQMETEADGDDEDGGSDEEDKSKALGGAKMARISTWVATDGEEYPVGGQTDVKAGSQLAKGLRVGPSRGAITVGDYNEEGGGQAAGMQALVTDEAMRKRLSSTLGYSPLKPRSNKVAPMPPIMAHGTTGSEDMDMSPGKPGKRLSAGGAPPPPPSDDGHSEGGDSAGSGASKMSGMSGLSGMSEEDNQDYRRGKRYRKLAKMLDGVEAQRVINRFKIHTLCLLALLLIMQTTAFAMMVVKINLQMTFMTSLSSSGYVSRFNMAINLYVRTIDNVMINKTVPGIYQEGLQYYLDQVDDANSQMHSYNEFIYFKMESMSQLDDTYGLRTAFDVKPRNVFVYKDEYGRDVYQQMTLWELLGRFHMAVNNFLHLHSYWNNTIGGNSQTKDFLFIKNNGLLLYTTYREVLDALLYKAVANTDSVNTLHIIFLVLEGCVLCSFVTAYFAILLRQVSNQRYALYSVFIIIPIGLVRALANQSVKLLDDSDSEDEEEEGHGAGAFDADAKQQQQQQDPKALRKEMHTLMRKQRTNVSEDGRGTGAINVKMSNNDGKARRGCLRSFALRMRSLLGMPDRTSSKRQLIRDSKETIWLMLPIIMWGLLVMVIYVVGYVMLKNIAGPVADQNVINYVAGRTLRAAFFAQEYVTQEDPQKSRMQHDDLITHITRLSSAVQVMLVGEEAYTDRNVNETFALVSEGVTYSDANVADILFGTDLCLRKDQSKCRTQDDMYYAISQEGVVPMMYAYLDNLRELYNMSVAGLFKDGYRSAMSSEFFQLIWNIGSLDLNEGIQALVTAHENTVLSMFARVRTLHIILFVLGWIFAILFLLLLLRPMLRRSKREAKRVAELLSQLPPELNVEKLVMVTLKMQAIASGSGKEKDKGGGGDKMGGDDDDKHWRSVMKSSFTVGGRISSATSQRF